MEKSGRKRRRRDANTLVAETAEPRRIRCLRPPIVAYTTKWLLIASGIVLLPNVPRSVMVPPLQRNTPAPPRFPKCR
jgi:hypothetical protein